MELSLILSAILIFPSALASEFNNSICNSFAIHPPGTSSASASLQYISLKQLPIE